MKKQSRPVFLLASERSGTNYLRRRLNEWQSTAFGPSPPHFLKHLYSLEPYYGDLNKDINFFEFISDALKLCYNHCSPWDVEFKPEHILNKYQTEYGNCRSSILLSDLLLNECAIAKGYSSYLCKDNFLFDYAYQIISYLPNAKFIYLYRDPRDYALSQLKRKLATSNLYKIAQLWRCEQIKCIRLLVDPLFKGKILKISYESLITNENEWLKKICDFSQWRLNRSEKIDLFDTGSPEEWKNINKPTMKNNYNKFKKEMRKKQIEVIESIVWNQMHYLGYKPIFEFRPPINKYKKIISNMSYMIFDYFRIKLLEKQPDFQKNFDRLAFLKKLKCRM
jgi:hypothetical protein